MADYLSRFSICVQASLTDSHLDLSAVYKVATIFGGSDLPVLLTSDLRIATDSDDILRAVLQYVSTG
jgi:hypothetical protein